jgi:hypothetical protein
MQILKCKETGEEVFKPSPKPIYNYNASDFLPKKNEVIEAEIVGEEPVTSDGRDYYCCFCQTRISGERVEALKFLGLYENEFACLKCAEQTVQKVKGVYLQESGSSPLVITKKIGADTHLVDINEALNPDEESGDEF